MSGLIEIKSVEGAFRVESRIIAENCMISHRSVMQLLADHQEVVEKHFGVLRFENSKPGQTGGRPEKVALLTEDQATFLITLMRNTEPVIHFKAALVKAFRDARDGRAILSAEEELGIAEMIASVRNAFAMRMAGTIDNSTANSLALLAGQYTRLWDVRLRMRCPELAKPVATKTQPVIEA